MGFPKRRGSLRRKLCLRGRSCRRGKLECAEELAGAEEVSCAGEIAGAMAIASVGLGFRRLLLLLTVLRESYVEGTTLSGGLPPYVSNRLVDLMIV